MQSLTIRKGVEAFECHSKGIQRIQIQYQTIPKGFESFNAKSNHSNGNSNCSKGHFQLFLHFIPAVPLLLLIATDENYCRVIETSGFHRNGQCCYKRNKYDYSQPHRPLQEDGNLHMLHAEMTQNSVFVVHQQNQGQVGTPIDSFCSPVEEERIQSQYNNQLSEQSQ